MFQNIRFYRVTRKDSVYMTGISEMLKKSKPRLFNATSNEGYLTGIACIFIYYVKAQI